LIVYQYCPIAVTVKCNADLQCFTTNHLDNVFTSSSQKIEDKTRTVFVVDGDTIARFINGEIWPDMLEEYATETILSTQRALAKTEKELIASKKKGVTLEGEVERLTSELRQTVEQMRRMSVEHLRASAQVRAASEEMILASKQALEAMQRTA
jgi:septal ring factor EnvC (AmiA/AmiB activator)